MYKEGCITQTKIYFTSFQWHLNVGYVTQKKIEEISLTANKQLVFNVIC